jgi:hypothetical protein
MSPATSLYARDNSAAVKCFTDLHPLETLALQAHKTMADADLGAILEHHGPALTELDLMCCAKLGDGTLRQAARCAHGLTNLDLSGIGPAMTDEGLFELARAAPPLRWLALPAFATGACLRPLWDSLQRSLAVLALPTRGRMYFGRDRPPHMLLTHGAELRGIAGRCRVTCDGATVAASDAATA